MTYNDLPNLPDIVVIQRLVRLKSLSAERPVILGITGGIACGKSLVAAEFRRCGAKIVNADLLARQAVAAGSPALSRLVARFGGEILTAKGELDRAGMAERIFSNPAARADLETIVHPAIKSLAERELTTLAACRDIPLIVYEAPLLYEANAEGRVDLVLVVTAREEVQLDRLRSRDHLSESDAHARIAAQMPLSTKVARADLVLDNSGPPSTTATAVDYLFTLLTAPRTKKSP